ncbi:hypothetical protein ACQ4LE_003568 [Meloidogyne hapla]|uniref:Uncharacterized protein n=1 Tax=Meloidogyne hapla TaxID=6305 RepID=A0A1I8BE02_MELHA
MSPPLLSNILGSKRRGKSFGGNMLTTETMLTPYELEQLPLMLKELERANRHFWQMVCWRLAQKKIGKEKQLNVKKLQRGETLMSTPPERRRMLANKGKDDSFADGCALREVTRQLIQTLCSEGGSIDSDTDQLLVDYKRRLMLDDEECTPPPKMSPKGIEKRRGDFALKGRAISFHDKLENVKHIGNEENNNGKTGSISSGSSSGYSSEELAATTTTHASIVAARHRATNWLRQRANSTRSRSSRRYVCQAQQQRIFQLGELLNAEFHSTIFSHPEQFDIHERELKLLVWNRFSQLLVSLLCERIDDGKDEDNNNQQKSRRHR